MRFLVTSLWVLLAGPVCSAAVVVEEALSRPLIIGASVSSGYSTTGPATRASLRYTSKANIVNLAESGKPFVELRQAITSDYLRQFTSVIAVDLLFWDSTLTDPLPSEKLMIKLIRAAKTAGIPLVLGDIPELWMGHQPARHYLNISIRHYCTIENSCYLFPFESFVNKMSNDGGMRIGRTFYSRRDLTKDGYHPTEVAAKYLADRLVEVLQSNK